LTAVAGCRPRRSASTAAGIRAARSVRAARRPARAGMPSARRRSASRAEVIGLPGSRPADLACGQRGDAGHGLAVEQDKAPGDPVGDVDAVIVQQAGCQVPALAVGDRGPGAPLRAGDVEVRAVSVAGGPGQELADVACTGPGGQPVIDVGLAAARQGGAAPAEPAEEPGRCLDRGPRVIGIGPGPAPGPGGAAQPPHHVPGGEGVHEPAVPGTSMEASSAASHCSVRASSSSRGGRTPPAMSMCRRWLAALGRGC
jgi:hypothetical protein